MSTILPNISPVWTATLSEPLGKQIAIFDNFESLEINSKLNDVGNFSITFYDDPNDGRLSNDYWKLDSRITFIRDLPFFVDDFGNRFKKKKEFYGLLRRTVRSVNESGRREVIFQGFSYEHLLSRRVIAALEGTIRSDKSDPADKVICEYVIENCGSQAKASNGRYFYADYADPTSRIDADGVMPGFHVGMSDDAPVWSGVKSFENLLDAVKDISATKNVDFSVTGIGGGEFFLFTALPIGSNVTATEINAYTGRNKFGNRPVVFDVNAGNISQYELDMDHTTEATFVFVLGQGERTTRSILPWIHPTNHLLSPWNQIELARSGSQQEFVFQLKQFGDETLTEMAYADKLTFSPRQIPTSFYGYHYRQGDWVTAISNTVISDYRIVGVSTTFKDAVESISLDLITPRKSVSGQPPRN